MDFWQRYLQAKHLILSKIVIKWNLEVAVDPVFCVILDSSMVYTGGGIIVLQKILAAELGYCVQYTMFISSMHIFLKASIET